MRKIFALLAVLALVSLGGCTALMSLFGVQQDGTVTPGGGPLGTIATLVNYWIPGATALVGAVTTTIAALKARDYRKAFTSSAEVIEKGAAAGKAVADIKGELAVAHSAAGVSGLVEKALDKFVRE